MISSQSHVFSILVYALHVAGRDKIHVAFEAARRNSTSKDALRSRNVSETFHARRSVSD